MARQLSPAASLALKKRECVGGIPNLKAYQDQKGIWTIGYGHTGEEVVEGLTWTPEQCEAAFVTDTGWACECIEKHVTVALNDDQFGALVSFCFNIGAESFVDKFSGLKSLNAGDYAGIPKHFDLWCNITVDGKLVKDPGLVNRRNSEDGQWVSNQYVRSANIVPSVPPPWYAHPKVKAIVTTATGVSGTAVLSAASQAQSLSSTWHPAIYAFIGLSVLGMIIGLVQQQKSNN